LVAGIMFTYPSIARADCDRACTAAMFYALLNKVNAVVMTVFLPSSQLTNMGNAASNIQTLTTASVNEIKHTNAEGFKTRVNSDHILKEKLATLDIVKERNRTFGSVSKDLCYEVDTLAGNITKSPINIEDRTRSYSRTINREIKTPAFGRRIWKEFDAQPQSLAGAFADDVWDDVSWFNTGKLVKAVSQSTWFPTPTDGNDVHSLEYKRLFDEFTAKQDIARQAIAEHMQRGSINLEGPLATYIEEIEQDIGVDRLGSNFDDLIALVGESNISGEMRVRNSSMSGDELKRLMIMAMAQRNFLLSQVNHMHRSRSTLKALSNALDADAFYEPRLEDAYSNIN